MKPLIYNLILFSLLITFSLRAHMESPLKCEITIDEQQTLGEPVQVKFVINNLLDQDIELLTWYTPIEGFLSNLFVITNAKKQAVTYQGPMFKRGKPANTDFITLAAKAQHISNIDLTQAYQLTPGRYQLKLIEKPINYRVDKLKIKTIACPTKTLFFNLN